MIIQSNAPDLLTATPLLPAFTCFDRSPKTVVEQPGGTHSPHFGPLAFTAP
jgi:hypothetical protein